MTKEKVLELLELKTTIRSNTWKLLLFIPLLQLIVLLGMGSIIYDVHPALNIKVRIVGTAVLSLLAFGVFSGLNHWTMALTEENIRANKRLNDLED